MSTDRRWLARPLAWLLAAVLLVIAAAPAAAKTERKVRYSRGEVFRCFIRLLRVDLELKILEKDLDGGFVLFEYQEPIYKRSSPASLEIIELLNEPAGKDKEKPVAPDGPRSKLRMEIKRAGASDEIGLLDKLEAKLREDFGRR